MKKYIYSLLVGSLFLTSCGEGEDNQAITNDHSDKKIENCIYTYNAAKSELNWTAYKFLNKTGVNGSFKTVNIDGSESSADPKSLISSLSFSIPVSSTETNDPSRNDKIIEFFFGKLTNTEVITGKVVKLGEDGVATLSIMMNEIEKEVQGQYILDKETFTFQTEINVEEWNASSGIESLNEACEELHTDVQNGDTESKLWSEVTISFKTELTKNCD